MKYSRLTKEQFESLQQEFITFLATQSITAKEWENIKQNKPEVAEDELDLFSDLIWEGVLSKASYLENVAPQQIFLFRIGKNKMHLIVVKITDTTKDITTTSGYQWLQQSYLSEEVEFFTSEKEFSADKHLDIFSIIQQGAVITKGELFEFFSKILNN